MVPHCQSRPIQLDSVLPERFDLDYAARDGSRQRPVIIHRAIFGSLERFMGVLLEHHGGHLPPWLAPEQVMVASISAKERGAARRVMDVLRASGLRVRLDDRDTTLGKKVAYARELGIPFLAVVGAREVVRGEVALRSLQPGARANHQLAIAAARDHLVSACRIPLDSSQSIP